MDNAISKLSEAKILVSKVSDDQKRLNLNDTDTKDLKNVAEQFEAIFVHQMLKQARKSKLAEGIFNSEAQDTFYNLLDIEYSQVLSKKNNFGIAEALVKQFDPHLQIKKVK